MIAVLHGGPEDGRIISMDQFVSQWNVIKAPELDIINLSLTEAVPMVKMVEGHYTPSKAMYGATECYLWSALNNAIIFDWRGWDE